MGRDSFNRQILLGLLAALGDHYGIFGLDGRLIAASSLFEKSEIPIDISSKIGMLRKHTVANGNTASPTEIVLDNGNRLPCKILLAGKRPAGWLIQLPQ